MSELVYLKSFWPTPAGPPRYKIELNVVKVNGEPLNYRYEITVTDQRGSFRGRNGHIEATSTTQANLDAVFHLVELLGSMLADADARIETGS